MVAGGNQARYGLAAAGGKMARNEPQGALRATTMYTEWPILHPALADRVVCTWVNPATQARRPVLPDACMDIVWDGARLIVAGPDTGPAESAPDVTFVGLRFQPGAAPGFLRSSADELRDRRVPLGEFWGRGADELAERIADSPHLARVLLGRAVRARLARATPVDPLVAAAMRELAAGEAGAEAIGDLAERLGADERTLRRRCSQALGYGPKTLARILRFRRALRLGRAGLPLAAVAASAGYADQAHLSRECRRLAGATPGTLFADTAVVLSSVEPLGRREVRFIQDAARRRR
jgi:AraC-like DNA-binding protein